MMRKIVVLGLIVIVLGAVVIPVVKARWCGPRTKMIRYLRRKHPEVKNIPFREWKIKTYKENGWFYMIVRGSAGDVFFTWMGKCRGWRVYEIGYRYGSE